MSNATTAGAEVTLLGQEYILSPLRLRDLEEIEIFMQGRTIAAGRASLPEGCNVEEEERLMQPIVAAAMKISAFNIGANDLRQPSLLVRILYQMLKQRNENITLDLCRKIVTNGESMKAFISAYLQMRPGKKNPPSPPHQAGEPSELTEVNGSLSSVKSMDSPPQK